MTHSEWCDFARKVRAIAERIDRSRHARGFAIAVAAGISPDMCCIHNCSISEVGSGWGANPGGRERIKAARHAKRLLDDWSASGLADRIINRAYAKVCWSHVETDCPN